MPDNKSKRGKPDRSRVAGGEAYEVRDFAKAQGITQKEAAALIKKHGNSRATLVREAKKLKAR